MKKLTKKERKELAKYMNDMLSLRQRTARGEELFMRFVLTNKFIRDFAFKKGYLK